MKAKPFPAIQSVGGYDVSIDPVYLADTSSPNLRNTRLDKNLIKKDFGLRGFDILPVLGTPMLNYRYVLIAGTVYDILFTTTSVYYWDATNLCWQDMTQGVVISNCEDVWTASANVTATADATVFKLGTKSAKLVIADLFGAALAAYRDFDVANYTTYTHIHLWVRSSINLDAGDIQLLLDDTSGCTSPLETINFPALTAATWTRVRLTLATPANLTAIISVGLKVAVDKGACTLYLDDIRAVKELTGTMDNRFSAAVANDILIFTNGLDVIKKSTGLTIADLGGSPPSKARAVVVFYNHVILLGTTEGGTFYPQRTRWSSAGTTETWSGGTSGYIDLVDTPDWCVTAALMRSKCFVWKERTIWELVYVGGTAIFDYKLRVDEEGTSAPQSLVSLGETVIFFGTRNVQEYDGARLTTLSEKLFPLFYEPDSKILNETYIKRICAVWNKELQEYWLCIPTLTGTPDTLIKYKKQGDSWTRKDNVQVTSFGKYSITSAIVTWATITGSWASQTRTWPGLSLPQGALTTLACLSNGETYEDDRSTYSTEEMVYETKDFVFGHASRVLQVRVVAKGGPFTLSHSVDGGKTFSSGQAFGIVDNWTEFVSYLNVTTQTIRFKIYCTAKQLEVKWIEPWYITRQESLTLSVS